MIWQEIIKRLEQRVPFVPRGGILEITLEEYDACVEEYRAGDQPPAEDFKLWVFRERQLKIV